MDVAEHGGPEPERAGRRRPGSVVVMGGTSGIGAAIAERFAERGDRVFVGGLRADEAPRSLHTVAKVVEVDVTRGDELESFLAGFDAVDALVNAAGIIRRNDEFDPGVFARVLEVNLTAVMRSCVAVRPAVREAGGAIVNIASMLSFAGGPLVPGYSASKGGVVQLTKALAVAWASDGIRVNAVAPGWIRTDLTAGVREDEAAAARIIDRTPMRRWGDPRDVAGAVEFLCGPDAGFVTGAVLPVDGGYLAA